MTYRPDSPKWLAAKAVGDRAELAVAEWFQSRGYAVFRTMGEIAFDLLLQCQVEVKHDLQATKSRRVAIEVEHKGHPSGIVTTAATWWAIVIGGEAVIVKADVLRELVRSPACRLANAGDGKSTIVALIPLSELTNLPGVFKVPLAGVS